MHSLHVLLLAALLLVGCVREEFPDSGAVAEGKPSQIALNLIVPEMNGHPVTRALTPDEETKINDIRVMIFRPDGSILTNSKYSATGTKVTVESYSGSNYTFCFIANATPGVDSRLQSVVFLSEVGPIVATATASDLVPAASSPLMMTGQQDNVTIAPGKSTYETPVQLHFVAAKVTLIVKDNTPAGQKFDALSWDVENAPARSHLFLQASDINQPGTSADKDEYWLTTDADHLFETKDDPKQTVTQTLYVFENRRGNRVNRALPVESDKQYNGMGVDDQDERGKAWFKPPRATAIVINGTHKGDTETRPIKAYIYLGADSHSDYNIERGKHYTFTVTVNGLNDIKVDSNVDYVLGELLVEHGDNLTMDVHPDFRPMRIHAPKGKVTMEILDNAGRTYNELGFDAKWLKISPLDLMYHQVKQQGQGAEWQQDANPDSKMVRPKYIPHKSVREVLEAGGIGGWNTIPNGQEDDDAMTFADATHRMCYKITDIPFTEVTLTAKTLHVYADEFLEKDGIRSGQVRFTFYKDGGNPNKPEVRTLYINQRGYISPFLDEKDTNAGLWVQNEDGTDSDVRNNFVLEREMEFRLALYPDIDVSLQRLKGLTWGFGRTMIYWQNDQFRNGKFLTANLVYKDVQRVDNEATGFGKGTDSYREMYNGVMAAGNGENYNNPLAPYSGQTSGAPYYHPDMGNTIYHPIYKTSPVRYCHEKNRDVNGDGIIDDSEAHWYSPSADELYLIGVTGVAIMEPVSGGYEYYTSSSESTYSFYEFGGRTTYSCEVNYLHSGNLIMNLFTYGQPRCIRSLRN